MKLKPIPTLFILLLTLLLQFATASPSRADDDYLIAFTSAVDIDFLDIERGGIFIMRPDGSGVRQLTSFQTLNYDFAPHGLNLPDDHPAFSPDGTKIAFASERSGNFDIWVMNASNGNNPTRITTSSLEDIEPAYSPNGSQIAFSRVQGDDEKDVFVINSDGSNERQLTTNAGEDHDPTFSPDGTQLVITSERAGTRPFGDVFKIRLSDGASLGNLTSNLNNGGGDPAWSPDGSQVAFFRSSTAVLASPQQLWRMSSNGTNRQRLDNEHDFGVINIHPNWGIAADTDNDGRPNYLENTNRSHDQTDFATNEGAGDLAGTAVALADYNHDTYLDLFVGIPGENVSNTGDAGKVAFAFGSTVGPYFIGPAFSAFPTIFTAADLGSSLASNGRFGQTMVSCDFNNDGFQDIAIGAPGQNRIFVSIGQPQGWQTISGSGGFGAALAGGDFNNDNRCDLAVSSPQESRSSTANAGAVRIFNGTSSGIASSASKTIDQATLPAITDVGGLENGDQFGYSLAAGNINGDVADDLAIGTLGEDIAGTSNAGIVHIIPGSSSGLATAAAVARDGRSLPSPHTGLQTDAQFGESLAMGNFNNNVFDAHSLAVGIPRQNIGNSADVGLTAVYEGAISGTTLLAATPQLLTLADLGSSNSSNARFGSALATGDMSGDSIDDLAASAPGQTVSSVSQAGKIYLIYGSRSTSCNLCSPLVSFGGGGLVAATAQTLTQLQVGSPLAANDHFGGSYQLTSANPLTIGDIDKDDQAELIIGTPEEDVIGLNNSGLVSIRFGIQVGETVLTPTLGTAPAETATTFTVQWTHPERWRDLTAMHLRWRGNNGIVLWLKYEEESNQFSLLDPVTGTFGTGAEPGSSAVLETAAARLLLAESTAISDGPEGRTLTLTMRVVFKTAVSNHLYDLEQMVQDDHGNNQGFDKIGSWGVSPFRTALPIVTKP